jgi:hypothetical protein
VHEPHDPHLHDDELLTASPPAPMPPGRGLTWAMWDDAPYQPRRDQQALDMLLLRNGAGRLAATRSP